MTQQGHQHAEETVSKTTDRTSMTLPLRLEGGVDTRAIGIALGHAMGHMLERMAQTRGAAPPHPHLTAWPAWLRDRCPAALRASSLIIAFSQWLGRFRKQPGGHLPPDPRQRPHKHPI